MSSPRVCRALVSVSNKSGLIELVRELVAAGVEIFSTGGTRAALEEQGLSVRDVSAYTGFPEMMDGRLKTLHPSIFGGILCRHDRPDDMQSLAAHGIETFELVVVNLYPFEETAARPGVTLSEAIEQIDIGGPSLVRAAAKNHLFATIATDPAQYAEIARQIRQAGATTPALRLRLARQAFERTARYDRAISDFLTRTADPQDAAATADPTGIFPPVLDLQLHRHAHLRYGENPHQPAALYAAGAPAGTLVGARQLHGKELSYNNLLDLHSAWLLVRALPAPAAVVLKHNNPCGAAAAPAVADAARAALDGDPLSAFGGVLGFNVAVDKAAAEVLCEPGRFVEAIVAPRFEPAAVELLTTRPKWKDNVRLLEAGEGAPPAELELRAIDGGFLAQRPDWSPDIEQEWSTVTQQQPTAAQQADLRFAWSVVRHVKSNAIVLCAGQTLLGAGAGQMSRVDAVEIAIKKAGTRAVGSVLASDAFFPFEDSIDLAADAGVAAIIQPGGSRKDQDVIQACNRRGLAMIFTGRRHFKH